MSRSTIRLEGELTISKLSDDSTVKKDVAEFEGFDPAVVEAGIKYLYHFDYRSISGGDQTTEQPMIFDVQVVIFADFLQLDSLSKFAAMKFAERAEQGWNTPSFVNAIELAYRDGTCRGSYLRDAITSVAAYNAKSLYGNAYGEKFRDLVAKTPALGTDLWTKCVNGTGATGEFTSYRCTCGFRFAMSMQFDRVFTRYPEPAGWPRMWYCPGCGCRNVKAAWETLVEIKT